MAEVGRHLMRVGDLQDDGYAPIEAESSPMVRAYPEGYDKEVASYTAMHAIACAKRRLPCVEFQGRARKERCVIVGSSPSVVDYLDDIRALKADGAFVFAINDANNLLQDHGIVPDGMVVLEVGVYPPALGWKCHPDTTFYVASLCHDETFEGLAGHKIVVWHVWTPLPFVQDIFASHFDYPGGNAMMVCGGNTTFTRITPLALAMGYRHFSVYGVDSSHPPGASHFFGTPYYAGKEIEVFLGPKKDRFLTRPIYAQQADEFRQWCLHNHHMFTMRCYGPGLLPTMHRMMFPDQYMEASDVREHADAA